MSDAHDIEPATDPGAPPLSGADKKARDKVAALPIVQKIKKVMYEQAKIKKPPKKNGRPQI